jgi:hypothetical protein
MYMLLVDECVLLVSCIPPAHALCCLPATVTSCSADLADKAGQYSSDVAVCGLLLGVMAGGYWLVNQRLQSSSVAEPGSSSSSSSSSSVRPPLPSLDPGTPEEVLQRK